MEGKTIHISRENLLQSVLKDVFMMCILLGSFYINYKYINGNIIIDILLAFAFIGVDCRLFTMHKYYKNVSEKKLESIKKILEENKNGK